MGKLKGFLLGFLIWLVVISLDREAEMREKRSWLIVVVIDFALLGALLGLLSH